MNNGVITDFDDKYQKGIVVDSKKNLRFVFTTIAWKTNACMPSKNMKVTFRINKENTREVNAVVPLGEPLPSAADENIYVSRSIDKCMNLFFGNVMAVAHEFIKDDTKKGKTYDFLLIKTFLLTAYNNLVEIDPTLGDKSLAGKKSQLVKIFKSYILFKKQTQYTPSFLFYDIFLKKQVQYMRTEIKMTEAQQAKEAAESREKSVYSLLQNEEKALKKAKKDSRDYIRIEIEVKKLRTMDMKLLDDSDKQKKIRNKYQALLERFRDEHYPIFEKEFLSFRKGTINSLVNIMNKRSYELDRILWGQAKKSGTIKSFFADANIVGTFSFKTYLKYFLKHLDAEKANTKTRELIKLLAYIENTTKHKLVVLDSASNKWDVYKRTLLKLDNDFEIRFIRMQEQLITYLIKETPDVLFINVSDVNMSELIRAIRKIKQQEFINIDLVGLIDKNTPPEQLEQYIKIGLSRFVTTNVDLNDLESSFRMAF